MLFPKPQTKKKRKKHRESLLQNKESRICYLCARRGDYSWKQVLEEHHIFGGPNRHLSEEYGLKVYICGMPQDISQSSASGSGGRSEPISAGGRAESIRREFPGIKFPGDLWEKLSVRKKKWKITKNASMCRALEHTRYMLIRDAQKRTK